MWLNLNKLLPLKRNEAVGLDIGSFSVKMIKLNKNKGQYSVSHAKLVPIDDYGANKELREINTVNAIRQCLSTADVQTNFAVCGVCGSEVNIRDFTFPSLEADEIGGAVNLEAEQICPFNIKDGTVDYQLQPKDGQNVKGFFVAATNSVINTKKRHANNASLDCVMMDVDGLALLNCFNECMQGEYNDITAIVNIGNLYTTIAIENKDKLPFVRDIAFGGHDIIKTIAADFNLSSEAATRVIIAHGDSSQIQPGFEASLEKACRKLSINITETFRYYKAQKKVSAIENVFVCGGFSLVKNFAAMLGRQLGTNVVVWNPFNRISCQADADSRQLLQESGPALAVSAGLAMRSI